ncbi:hypothetical protein RB199_23715 [Streptomyces libani]|uniref:Uncharacterized protein n=2 Tax=Streptomyces nigrescens TaxID=1920 RepID=A0A640TUZ4_STRNI|nr:MULTISPECIES: hypothetical protein [Streptomyces]MCW7988576.1 hypothetical protein [Streptomyces platensis subsp. clarensis]MCR8575654.1 hypothetical protein [Streptomyces sp. Isolate_219]MCX5444227.1 hypothetical protein [Streptomyces libani]UYB44513.1 hypothetical protein SLV14_007610 [Streptomyces sp. Je 1-4]UZQ40975.1 hypothetical protein SLV14N_007610 [Streptomyces sp. Je 1-4] [Streptomyces sp. Je 1-4 4N24]
MTDPGIPQLQALPDGDAELSLVVRVQWEDVAALGQDAARLAARFKRPVTLDEAASHRLRIRPPAAHAKAMPQERTQPAMASTTVSPLPARSPQEQARQAIEKINGNASHETA